jgi:hypothetical protein
LRLTCDPSRDSPTNRNPVEMSKFMIAYVEDLETGKVEKLRLGTETVVFDYSPLAV